MVPAPLLGSRLHRLAVFCTLSMWIFGLIAGGCGRSKSQEPPSGAGLARAAGVATHPAASLPGSPCNVPCCCCLGNAVSLWWIQDLLLLPRPIAFVGLAIKVSTTPACAPCVSLVSAWHQVSVCLLGAVAGLHVVLAQNRCLQFPICI